MPLHRFAAVLLLAGCAAPPAVSPQPAADPPPPEPAHTPPAPPAPPPAPPAPVGRFSVETATTTNAGKSVAVLRITRPCSAPPCAPVSFELGAGKSATDAVLVDLRGSSFVYPKGLFDDRPGPTSTLPATATFPAVVVMVAEEGPQASETRLVVVSLRDDPPVRILSEVVSMRTKRGGGVSLINSIRFEDKGPDPLEISFSQTAMPAPGDKPYRPGPPLSRRFAWSGTRYVRKP